MLLKHLYDLAHSRQLLDDPAFAKKAIRWVIAIDAEGRIIGSGPQETTDGKNRGREFISPQTSRNKNKGGIAEFLADGLTGIFGLDGEPEKDQGDERKRRRRNENNAEKCADFWSQIEQAFEETKMLHLKALLAFRQRYGAEPPFLRWGPATEDQSESLNAWRLRTSAGTEVKLGADNFTFEVEGQLLLNDENVIRPYWRRVYQKEREDKSGSSDRGLCLITGEEGVPLAKTHTPKIKGVRGAQPTGAALVSFDKAAFTSYGYEQSYNAPASISAATAYSLALNWLLSQKSHSLHVGSTAVCFWARDSEEESDFFAAMLDHPDPQTVRDFLTSPWQGGERRRPDEQFFSVTLSGNAGRIVVRHWMQTTIETARENLHRWFVDLEVALYGEGAVKGEGKRKKPVNEQGTKEKEYRPLALYNLALSLVRDAKDLQSEMLTHLYRAALEGTAPSLLLLNPLLNRLRIDLVREGPNRTLRGLSRFALLRLILNRNRKVGEPMIEPQVFDTDDPAYNCGRLLAVFDDLQMRAHDFKLEGAGVVERYYGSASSAPNSAFGILWRLHQHHLKKVSRQSPGAAEAIKRKIAEITCQFRQERPNAPPAFPRTFNLQEQGRFALGFYQQKAADDAARRAAVSTRKTTETSAAAEE
ncbi:MAG: type I-C CRISPR-associated protein Cas8c/Csd1 [Acidobacteria bacterium]|nr:type I-C CRISPR-associated protein Cas8c/Csd1 [Acidobacteriota bacterium]